MTLVTPQPQRYGEYWLWLNQLYTTDELRQRLDYHNGWHWRINATPKPVKRKRKE